MNYDLKISIEELSLLKSVLFDYNQRLDDEIISAKHLMKRFNAGEDEETYERLILSKQLKKHEVVCLMGKLQNIIPIAKKLTEEN